LRCGLLAWTPLQRNFGSESLVVGCVTIERTEGAVSVNFRYKAHCAGAPNRSWTRKTLVITGRQWGQIVYNGRFPYSWQADWWYEKMVINVGLFERLTPDLFIHTEPTYRFSAMGELF